MNLVSGNNSPAVPARDGWFRFLTIPAAAIVVATIITIYSNSIDCPFLLDDTPSIIDNQSIKNPWTSLLPPPGGATISGRPLANMSLAINYSLGQLNVRGYHIFNICVHIVAALALMGLIRQTLLLPSMNGRYGKAALPLATMITLLWAAHPIHTQAVTYIVQRTESMMAMFTLLTLYFMARSGSSRRPGVWRTAAIVACAAGMACKESMVAVPFVAMLYYITFIRQSWREFFRKDRRLIIALSATLMVLVAMLAMSGFRGGMDTFSGRVAWHEYLLTQSEIVIGYLATAFLPTSLVFDYGWTPATSISQVAIPLAAVAAMLAATIFLVIRKPKVGFLPAAFFMTLAPTSSVLPLSELACEYRMYLPLAAVIAAVVLVLFHAIAHLMRLIEPSAKIRILGGSILGIVITGCVLSLLGMLTFQRNQDFADAMTIWNDTVEKRPMNPRAQMQLGYEFRHKDQPDRAISSLLMAVQIKPDYAEAWNNLGLAYKDIRDGKKSIEAFNKAISLKPDFTRALANRGTVHALMEEYEPAIADYNAAIATSPNDAMLYYNRGNIYMGMENFDKASEDYSRAIGIDPNFADPYLSRAECMFFTGQLDKASSDHEQYRRLTGHRFADLEDAIKQCRAAATEPTSMPATSTAPAAKE